MKWLFGLCAALVACDSTLPNIGPDVTEAGADTSPADAMACEAGKITCNGECVDTQSSALSCGGCNWACGASESCCKGVCTSDPTCGFAIASVSPKQSWVSGNAWITVKGSGFGAGTMRAWVGEARAPVRVVDSNTALVLTPPARVGVYDLHLKQGTLSATLPNAISVRTKGFGKQWVTISMSTPRGNFPAMTTLQDGRVLVVGGSVTSLPSTTVDTGELYDPVTQKMTLAANSMSTRRNTVSAITLMDGRALIVGTCNVPSGTGCFAPGDRQLADLFDPKTNKFSPTKTPLVSDTRVYLHLVMLPDGKVLVSSGSPTAEIFDPATDSFSTATFTSGNAAFGVPSRLRDGRVLFVSDKSEILDPDTSMIAPLNVGIAHGAAAVYTLPDGRVASPGGADNIGGMITPTNEIALVDAIKPAASVMPQKLSSPRLKFASALLGDGTVMVAGGVMAAYPATYGCQVDTFPTTKAVDVVDPALGSVAPFPPINDNNMELVATTLVDGSILIGGGAACGGAGAYPYVYFLQSVPPPN